MEDVYNWGLILKVAVPASAIEAYVFYTGMGDGWKLALLAVGLLVSGLLVYARDKRKKNISTAVGIVLLAALVVRLLMNLGLA